MERLRNGAERFTSGQRPVGGEGGLVKTFLLPGQHARGRRVS